MDFFLNKMLSSGTLFLMLVAVVSMLACEARNPLCNDNFCVEGKIYPKSNLEADAVYDAVSVDDTQILALLADPTTLESTTPQSTPEPDTTPVTVESITLADIVSDVASGGTTYLENTVTITALVRFNLALRGSGTSLSLETHTDSVFFFITDRDNPASLHSYHELKNYTFKIYIRSIFPPDEEFDDYAVFAHIVE